LGTGTFTIAAPNSNSSPTLTLPNSSGTVVVTGGAQTIEFAAGTVSAPSITTTGDTNTGIFFPAADTIAFTEGGVEAMRIDSSGRVGIGTTNPSSPLTISKSGSTAIEIPSGASVPVNAYGATTGASTFAVANTGGTSYFGNESSVGGTSFVGTLAYATCVGTSAAQALQFITNNTARATIDSSGNVGIGTTSPTHKLNIVGTNGSEFKITRGTNDFIISLENNAGGIVYVGTAAASPLIFQTSNTERARITSGGYFKASDSGSYDSSTGTYHELRQTANSTGVFISATNASYTATIENVRATRAATSLYNFYLAQSGAGGDTEFILRGDGNAFADGTWGSPASDYAEYFESSTGQAISRGITVVLENGKVRPATAKDSTSAIIGVIRPKEWGKGTSVLGNFAWGRWKDKYLTDDFGVYIMEDHDVVEWEEQVLEREAVAAVEAVVDKEGNEVSPAVPAQEATYKTVSHSYESHNIPAGITVSADATVKTHDDKGNKFQHRKLNPEYDAEIEYTPRNDRPEWNIVGLLGQVPILKGQPVGDRWIKMRDVSATVEEWMIR